MLFGIIGRTSPGMRQVVRFGIGTREGVFLGANLGPVIVTNGDFTVCVCDSAATRPSSQITLGRLVRIAQIVRILEYSNNLRYSSHTRQRPGSSVIFVNENENENGEKRENKEFVNEN